MKIYAIFLSFCLIPVCLAGTTTPYAGEQNRTIKSMSSSEIEGYLSGKGMGLAKAAELNGYPGPKHVLELKMELNLSRQQVEQTQALYQEMQSKASKLGVTLVEQERVLDQLFSSGRIDQDSLTAQLQKISNTRAKIRQSHLEAHIKQKSILSSSQVMLYKQHRGYEGEHGQHKAHHHHQ